MAAAAIPAISMGAQYFMNRGKNKQIGQQQQAGVAGLQNSATDLNKFGDKIGDAAGGFLGGAQKQFTSANNSLDQSANYFSPLLRGGRAAIDQHLAPERAGITETYRGAGKAIEQSGMRGGTRDLANAELNRDRAAKLALLPAVARGNAAGAMLDVGQTQGSMAAAQAGTAANLFGSATQAKGGGLAGYGAMMNNATDQWKTQQAYGNQSGAGIGSMIFDAMKSQGKKSGGGGPAFPGQTPGIAGGYPGTPGWSMPGVTAPRFG